MSAGQEAEAGRRGAGRLIVSYLPEPESHPLWPDIRELLKPAVISGDVLDENELVWIAYRGTTLFGAGTTAVQGDIAVILTCGGFRHRLWIEQAEAVVSAWARDCGARRLTMRGRMGWARYFRAFGWVVLGTDETGRTIYEKDLGE